MTQLKANVAACELTIAQAKRTVQKVEDSAERIKTIIEQKSNVSTRRPASARAFLFSSRFASFVLVCTVLLLAIYGLLIYHTVTEHTKFHAEVAALTERVTKLETEVRVYHTNPTNAVTQKRY